MVPQAAVEADLESNWAVVAEAWLFLLIILREQINSLQKNSQKSLEIVIDFLC